MTQTRIEWADYTYNPVWGCNGGCPYCYARGIAKRFGKRVCGRDDFKPTWVQAQFEKSFPRKPSWIFVGSMSDVAQWKPEWFRKVMDRALIEKRHTYLFLSKTPWLLHDYWPYAPNIKLGATITNQDDMERLMENRHVHVSFLSIEPIMELIALPIIWHPEWIIIGAETGNRKERVIPKMEWLSCIHAYCRAHYMPLFYKDNLRWDIFPFGYALHEFPDWGKRE